MRWLRLVAFAISDVGLVLGVLTFVVRLDPIVRVVAVLLVVAGLALIVWSSALKAREGPQAHKGESRGTTG